jgi:hypothetical protein
MKPKPDQMGLTDRKKNSRKFCNCPLKATHHWQRCCQYSCVYPLIKIGVISLQKPVAVEQKKRKYEVSNNTLLQDKRQRASHGGWRLLHICRREVRCKVPFKLCRVPGFKSITVFWFFSECTIIHFTSMDPGSRLSCKYLKNFNYPESGQEY